MDWDVENAVALRLFECAAHDSETHERYTENKEKKNPKKFTHSRVATMLLPSSFALYVLVAADKIIISRKQKTTMPLLRQRQPSSELELMSVSMAFECKTCLAKTSCLFHKCDTFYRPESFFDLNARERKHRAVVNKNCEFYIDSICFTVPPTGPLNYYESLLHERYIYLEDPTSLDDEYDEAVYGVCDYYSESECSEESMEESDFE